MDGASDRFVIMGVATGELNEEQLFEWFERHTVKVLV